MRKKTATPLRLPPIISDFLGIILESLDQDDLAYCVDYEALREPLTVPEHLGGLPRGIRGEYQ